MFYKYQTADPKTFRFLKELQIELQRNPTITEVLIWELLRNKKTGFKFRRQHIIENYIVDFVCIKNKLIIEIDGEIHLNQRELDASRTTRLNEIGFEVIRFSNHEVIANPQKIIQSIVDCLTLRNENDCLKNKEQST